MNAKKRLAEIISSTPVLNSKFIRESLGVNKINLDSFLDYASITLPRPNESWSDAIKVLKVYENEVGLNRFQQNTEFIKERIQTLEMYFSSPDSFLFVNIGAYNRWEYGHKKILNLLDNRLKDSNFNFIATIPLDIKENPFVSRLLRHPEKGAVFQMREYEPLHFISSVYKTKYKHIYWLASFEDEHYERQIVKRRISLFSPDSLCTLYCAQLKKIVKEGKIYN